MLVHKAFKYRIYPTNEQKVLLSKHFGCARFVFNHFLNERKETYLESKKSLSYKDNAAGLTKLKKDESYSWLKEVNSQTLQSSLRNLETAYTNFFKKYTKFPKFKSKYHKQSFKVPQKVKVKSGKLSIPKFREGIKIKLHRPISGKIISVIISKTPTDKYYASIHCQVDHLPLSKTGSSVGIDTGIKDLAILSDGTTYPNHRYLKKSLKKLKYNQRQLSKKKVGSKSRGRQRKKVAGIYEKVTNQRTDLLHKVSTEIIKNHDVICVESLVVKNMMKNKSLSLALNDVSLGKFYGMLNYKAKWNERTIVKIDRFFPSSKTCSNCGWIKQDLKLSDREWVCPSCGEHHDRDLNASKNILRQGLNILSGSGVDSDIKQKQVEASSLEESMKPGVPML